MSILRASLCIRCWNLGRSSPHLSRVETKLARFCKSGYGGEKLHGNHDKWTQTQGRISTPLTEFLQDLSGGFHTVILGFFENGDAAQIRVGEEDAIVEALDAAAFLRKN